MKKNILLFLIGIMSPFALCAQDNQKIIDSIEQTLKYEHGTISLKGGIGKIDVPPGFKYLGAEQADHVLVDLWGNPKTETGSLGMLLPENQGVLSPKGYVFNIEYDEIGYVKDDDADDIDYDDLLKQLQKETTEANDERVKSGYDAVTFVGWASKPFYDKERNILHWAKDLKFGSEGPNTLNYNVRILGRKGVLVLNAISTMPELPLVQKDINKVLNIVHFSDGLAYKDFDSKVDNVAAWTIGGLVAGKILAKVGFFALILKFWKLIAIGVVAAFTAIRKFFGGKKEQVKEANFEESEATQAEPAETAPIATEAPSIEDTLPAAEPGTEPDENEKPTPGAP